MVTGNRDRLAGSRRVAKPFGKNGHWSQYLRDSMLVNEFSLVIAYRPALVISKAATVVRGLAAAATRGILPKGGIYLENALKIKVMSWTNWNLHGGQPKLVVT